MKIVSLHVKNYSGIDLLALGIERALDITKFQAYQHAVLAQGNQSYELLNGEAVSESDMIPFVKIKQLLQDYNVESEIMIHEHN